MKSKMAMPVFFQLVRRRECWALTRRGWLLVILLAAGLAWGAVKTVYPFLATNEPLAGGTLVVEGWGNDEISQAAVAEIRRQHYRRVIVTGGPIEYGALLVEYPTFAEAGAAILLRLGLDTNEVIAVPAPRVVRDRTYAAAVALRDWLDRRRDPETKLTVMTAGPHARRTQYLFQRALEPHRQVGVLAIPPRAYTPARWWLSSAGFRTVTGEAIAYAYVRLSPSIQW
ncbi:MAG: ElyC/SanA/YdcF family protein [Verrucomicrobiota bacterium]